MFLLIYDTINSNYFCLFLCKSINNLNFFMKTLGIFSFAATPLTGRFVEFSHSFPPISSPYFQATEQSPNLT